MKKQKKARAVQPDDLDEMINAFASVTDPDKMKTFFEEIFTPAERETFRLRWTLLKMLKKNVPQREIASELHISLCKITRGSKLLKMPDSVVGELVSGK